MYLNQVAAIITLISVRVTTMWPWLLTSIWVFLHRLYADLTFLPPFSHYHTCRQIYAWCFNVCLVFSDGDPENQFSINPEFGSIVTSKRLDRERRDHYNLTVMATDGIHHTSVKVIAVYRPHTSSIH